MATPASFEDTLHRHDTAFYLWLGRMRVDYGDPSDFPDGFPFKDAYPARQNFPILRTQATRERAFANVVSLLVSLRWISAGTADQIRQSAGDFSVLPLPIVTFERGDPEIDPTSGSVPKRFGRSRFDQTTGMWESHPWPATYFVPYRATFWCSKRYTEAFMREWVQSQLGLLGVADKEVLIPVVHRDPWGTQQQVLQFDGSSDLSDLEGETYRHIRYELSFRMRMLHFRPNVVQDYPISAISLPSVLGQVGDVDGEDPFDREPDIASEPVVSDNLYLQYYSGDQIATKWPRDGGAIVAKSNIAPPMVSPSVVIAATVRSTADHVGVTNRPAVIDGAQNNIAILSIAAMYRSTAEVALKTFERDGVGPTWTLARGVVLPATSSWTDFQFFTLVDQSIFSVELEGRMILSTVHFTDVDVRQVFSQARISATGVGSGLGGSTKRTWNALPNGASYLVVVIPDTHTGVWSMRVEDDENSPDHVITRNFDAANERGYVELIQPKAGSIALSIPAGFPSATIFIQPYPRGSRPRL